MNSRSHLFNPVIRTPQAVFTLLTMLLALSACSGGGGGSTPIANKPPSLNLVTSQTVVEDDLVTLSADGSTDSDGSITTIAWTQTSGTSVTLTNADTLTPTFTAPITDVQLTLVISVTLTDDDGDTADGSVTITVNPNVPPSANAGADMTYVEQHPVALDGSTSSDSDGTITSALWTQLSGPTVTLTNADTQTAGFTGPDITTDTTLEFSLKVTDNTGDFHEDTVIISLVPHVPPSLTSHYPCNGCRFYDSTLVLTGSASVSSYPASVAAPDSALTVTVTLGTTTVAATLSADGSWIAQDIPVDTTATTHAVTVTATDSYGAESSYVTDLAYRPTLTSAFIAPDSLDENIIYFFEDAHNLTHLTRFFRYRIDTDTFELLYDQTNWPDFVGQSFDITLDGNNNRVLIGNWSENALVSITLDGTAAPAFLTNASNGSGADLSLPRYFKVDADDNRAIVWNGGNSSLSSVDLATGNRSVLADNSGSFGTGTTLTSYNSMALHETSDISWLFTGPTILEVDLATGNRSVASTSGTIVSSPISSLYDASRDRIVQWSAGDQMVAVDAATYAGTTLSASGTSGVFIPWSRQVAHSLLSDQYLINGFSTSWYLNDTDSIISIDPDTGARSELVTDRLGTGPAVENPRNIVFDAASQAVYVLENNDQKLVKLDLATNVRTTISGFFKGSGPALATVVDLALDLANDRIYILQSTSLVAVEVTTGNRTIVSDAGTGTGPTFSSPTGAVIDATNNKIYITEDGLDAVVTIDLASGDRTILSDAGHAGEAFLEPTGLTLDATGNRLLVTDNGTGATTTLKLFSVDLASGDRTVISGGTTGSGTNLWGPQDVSLIDASLAVVAENGRVLLVDLDTGNRQTLADYYNGNNAMANLGRIAADSSKGIIYGWGLNSEALVQFDLNSGHMVIVSK